MDLPSAPALIWFCDPSAFWDASISLPWGALAKRNMHCQAGRKHWEAIFIHVVTSGSLREWQLIFLVKPTWKIVSWQFGDIHVPLGHFQVLMASWHNHGSWSCHPSSATSATLFSLGRHWGIWSYQRKASVKVCFSGILSNSTILRWQILLHGFFSHHTKIFRALWNWKSPREHYPLEENFIFGR